MKGEEQESEGTQSVWVLRAGLTKRRRGRCVQHLTRQSGCAEILTKRSILGRGNGVGQDWQLGEEFVGKPLVKQLANFS